MRWSNERTSFSGFVSLLLIWAIFRLRCSGVILSIKGRIYCCQLICQVLLMPRPSAFSFAAAYFLPKPYSGSMTFSNFPPCKKFNSKALRAFMQFGVSFNSPGLFLHSASLASKAALFSGARYHSTERVSSELQPVMAPKTMIVAISA